MYLLTIACLLLTLSGNCDSPETKGANGQIDSKYKMVWNDEFDYTGLPDAKKWSFDVEGNASGWGNKEAQFYTKERIQNAEVKDGFLTITALKEDYEGKKYTSARLRTATKGDWLYGRFEIRAKLPDGRGMWPAIWMLPTEWKYGGWPASGEIDIMESVGYDPGVIVASAHTRSYNHVDRTQKNNKLNVADCYTNFHLYALEWDAAEYRIYVDDQLYFTFKNEGTGFKAWPFDQKFHLLLNLAVGGNWGGAKGIDDSIFPRAMIVDYVRVYRQKEDQFWLTAPAAGVNFQKQPGNLSFGTASTTDPVISVDDSQKFQTIDGFGNCLTDGSAMLLARMSPSARSAILKELFAWDGNNIGISYLRISLGASDLSENCYSYNDLPAGESDFELKNFTIDQNRKELIPVLKEILRINPAIKIMASPWSAPTWMKTNNNFKGGSLRPECFEVYANYFVRYIQEMKAEGITIDAITVQNEPLHPGNTPSLYMTAEDQALFVKQNLGPAFAAAGIKTKIIVYDHNADKIIYPLTILRDPEAAKYVDGSAFHLYGGKIEALSEVHKEFPGKHLYFTEQWIGSPANFPGDLAWHVKTLIIGATRNWCRNVLEWNLASDPKNDPHTVGGCDRCLGTITLDGDKVTRNPAYYILAHAAKFVRPGSVRIESNMVDNLPNVAFKTEDGRIVLIVLNESQTQKKFSILFGGKVLQAELGKGAVGTFVW